MSKMIISPRSNLTRLSIYVGLSLLQLSPAQAALLCKDVHQNILAANSTSPLISFSRKDSAAEMAPKDKAEINRLAEAMWKSKNPAEKIFHLNRIESWMNYRFPGREPVIQRIMTAVRFIVINPEDVRKPTVIDLFGLPGDGKTDMVSTLADYLALGSRKNLVKIEDGQIDISLSDFRSLADVAPESGAPEVSFLILDEFQKLRRKSDLKKNADVTDASGQSNKNKDYGMVVDEFKLRERFVRLLYDIYGNGSEKAPPATSLNDYAARIDNQTRSLKEVKSSIAALVKGKLELEKANSENPSDDAKNALKEKIKEIEEASRPLMEIEDGVKIILKKLKRDYAEAMGPMGDLEVGEMANRVMTDPKVFTGFLKEVADESAKFQRNFGYKQMITFVLGNPENTIKELKSEIRGQKMDADQFNNRVMQTDPYKIQKELFEDVFGNDAVGLRQRLNVDQWSIMPPLANKDWSRFVQRQVETQKNTFEGKLKKAGIEVNLRIDSSIHDLLRSEAVISTESARVYFERANGLTYNFLNDLQTQILAVPPESRPDVISWGFDANTREYVILGYKQVEGKYEKIFEERAPVARLGNGGKNTEISTYERQRRIARKAGEILMGLSMYKSLPKDFRVDLEAFESTANDLWVAKGQERHTTSLDFIKQAVGSNLTKNSLRDGFISLGDPSIKFAHDMVKRMVEDLRKREEEYNFLVERTAEGKKVYSSTFPEPIGLSKEIIEALKDAVDARGTVDTKDPAAMALADQKEQAAMGKILKMIFEQIENTKQENSELLISITSLIHQKLVDSEQGKIQNPVVRSDEIMSIVQNNRNFSKPASFWQRLSGKRVFGANQILPESIRNEPGQIALQDSVLFAGSREFKEPKTRMSRFWNRLSYVFFPKPVNQRQIDAN